MVIHKVLLVGFLNFLDDFSKPLPLLLSTCHPDEEYLRSIIKLVNMILQCSEYYTYLLALNACSNIEPVHKLFQDRGKWSHTNSTTNKNGDLIVRPVLMALSEWTVKEELRIGLSAKVDWVVVLTEVVGPGSNGTDVEAEVFLMRSRGDGEGVEFTRILGSTGNLEPLSSFIVKRDGSLEVDSDNLRW